jgi:hypothetical protein
MSKELITRLALDGDLLAIQELVGIIESQAREIEELKNALYVSNAQLLESQHKAIELRAALAVAVDDLNAAERTTRKLEELGRMVGANDTDMLMGVETVFSKALTRCKEALTK